MTNTWDSVDYLQELWRLWTQLRSAKALGSECQALSTTLGRDALFSAADIAAFDTIMGKIKTEGLLLLAEGGDRVLTTEDTPSQFGGWIEEA